jgi:penicillin-binding protein 1A
LLLWSLAGGAQLVAADIHRVQSGFKGFAFTQPSLIYTGDNRLLSSLGGRPRSSLPLRRISSSAQQATIAIEDHAFYQHGAVDVTAIVRATIADVISGGFTQGGSTITEQLVKNSIYGSSADTLYRKFQEAAYALRAQQMYSKNQILDMYLNNIDYGAGQYGIGAAAHYYFNTSASKLTLVQAALLAGIPQYPDYYDPLVHPSAALARRNEVLQAMQRYGDITPSKEATAASQPLGVHPGRPPGTTDGSKSYFVYWVTQQLLDMSNHQYDSALGTTLAQRQAALASGGLRIYTTYDPQWQKIAKQVAQTHVTQPGLDVGIATVNTRTGAVTTLLSGQNYASQQMDLVTTQKDPNGGYMGVRQPGSSFKPYTLVAAIDQGISPNQTFATNSPMYLAGWPSKDHLVYNAEPASAGSVNLWTATADSINVVFAQLILQIRGEGYTVARVAHEMGVTAPLVPVPSITLGSSSVSPLDQASGYATLADNGIHCTPYGIRKITDSAGNILFKQTPDCRRVIPASTAQLVTRMLEGVVQYGTGTAAAIGRPQAGKTGTTQNYSDAWFVGYVPQYATAVWVGDPAGEIGVPDFQGMGPMYGGTAAAPIWSAYMAQALKQAGVPIRSFSRIR